MAENKVVFGVSELHFGTYDVAGDGTVTLGTPFHLPGTVNISLDAESESNTVNADNVAYWIGYSDNGYTGEIENVHFTDEFKTTFMNYRELTGGGIAQYKNISNKKVYIMFEGEGDAEKRRHIMYNVSLGQITHEHGTTEASKTPEHDTLPITVVGDNKTGLTRTVYQSSDAAYDTMFTTPPAPVAAP
jgi:phi13 family phage major tail protein